MTAIRIFVGCSANDEDLESQAVLDYTLNKHTSWPLDITWMKLSRDPASFWYSDPQSGKGWCTKGWATPFSALRWGIPAFCEFKGRAIYMDSDMIIMADIAALWNQTIHPTMAMISKGQNKALCVSMYDNSHMRQYLPEIGKLKSTAGLYREVRKRAATDPKMVQPFMSGNWNCLDGEDYASLDDPDIKIIHYTSIPEQPHLKHALPRLAAEGRKHWFPGAPQKHRRPELNDMFDRLLSEAVAAGYALDKYRTVPPFGDYGR